MPRYDVALTITVRDAAPEDVRHLLQHVADTVGPVAVQTPDLGSDHHLRQLDRVAALPVSRGKAIGPWSQQRPVVLSTLRETRGDVAESARRLGVTEQTMHEWARRCGWGSASTRSPKEAA